jgi:predicted peptidase
MYKSTQKGGLQAAKQLIAKGGSKYGFEVLWENKRLEALVLKPEYESLFSDDKKQLCNERLKQFVYIIGDQPCEQSFYFVPLCEATYSII